MRGLSKRKGSDNWQGRFRIPESLWRRRADLAALDVRDLGKSQEFTKSLGTGDIREATSRYRLALDAWDRKMEAWQALLDCGPVRLTHKQQMALAADYAKAFLVQHEDEPFDAPPPPPDPTVPDDGGRLEAAVAALPAEERGKLLADWRAYREADEATRVHKAIALLKAHPVLQKSLAPDFAIGLEGIHGSGTEAVLKASGLHVDGASRRLLDLEMASAMSAAYRALERRQGGDYGPVAELERAPAFSLPAPSAVAPADILTLEALLDHKASTHGIKAKTVSDTRAHLRKFAKFIEHDDARRVTKDDIRRWRDALIAEGQLSPKTITDRYLSAVRSVLEHGVKEFDLPSNAASKIRDNRHDPSPKGSKGYSEEEAVTILEATFRGSTKDLSAPHRRALFWVPWILAYTGLRVTEVTQFRARNLREERGVPYLLITPKDGSTKGKDGGKAWMVGIHQHLIDMGLLEFIRSFGDRPIFYEPYPAGTDPSSIKGKHRAQEAGVRVGRWITEELGIAAPLNRPNHAWRHLFTTRSRKFGMEKTARDFMMGSASIDAREGYGDWPPETLQAEINKLARFSVKDTGWRP